MKKLVPRYRNSWLLILALMLSGLTFNVATATPVQAANVNCLPDPVVHIYGPTTIIDSQHENYTVAVIAPNNYPLKNITITYYAPAGFTMMDGNPTWRVGIGALGGNQWWWGGFEVVANPGAAGTGSPNAKAIISADPNGPGCWAGDTNTGSYWMPYSRSSYPIVAASYGYPYGGGSNCNTHILKVTTGNWSSSDQNIIDHPPVLHFEMLYPTGGVTGGSGPGGLIYNNGSHIIFGDFLASPNTTYSWTLNSTCKGNYSYQGTIYPMNYADSTIGPWDYVQEYANAPTALPGQPIYFWTNAANNCCDDNSLSWSWAQVSLNNSFPGESNMDLLQNPTAFDGASGSNAFGSMNGTNAQWNHNQIMGPGTNQWDLLGGTAPAILDSPSASNDINFCATALMGSPWHSTGYSNSACTLVTYTPAINITKTVNGKVTDTVNAGTVATFGVNVANIGNRNLPSPIFYDYVDARLTSIQGGPDMIFKQVQPDGRTLVAWSAPNNDFTAGQNLSFTFTAIPSRGQPSSIYQITNTAVAWSSALSQNSNQVTLNVNTPCPTPSVAINVQAPAQLTLGTSGTYHLKVTNTGNAANDNSTILNNLKVAFDTSAGIKITGVTPGFGAPSGTNTQTFNLPNLTSYGQSISFDITVTLPADSNAITSDTPAPITTVHGDATVTANEGTYAGCNGQTSDNQSTSTNVPNPHWQ